jgi:hypothetical protein
VAFNSDYRDPRIYHRSRARFKKARESPVKTIDVRLGVLRGLRGFSGFELGDQTAGDAEDAEGNCSDAQRTSEASTPFEGTREFVHLGESVIMSDPQQPERIIERTIYGP